MGFITANRCLGLFSHGIYALSHGGTGRVCPEVGNCAPVALDYSLLAAWSEIEYY